MTAKSLYAYTLQPVIYEVSEEEQRHAQLVIWRSTNKIGMKAWIIMGVIVALSHFRHSAIKKLFDHFLLGCHCLCGHSTCCA